MGDCVYCDVPGVGYVNYIMTWIRIAYWIYLLLSLQSQQVKIAKNTLALVASPVTLVSSFFVHPLELNN
jgi:hypothetical protein